MKKYVLALVLLTAITAYAANAPYPKWINLVSGDITFDDNGVTAIGTDKVVTADILDGTILEADLAAPAGTEGLYPERVAVFIYDVATDLGTVGAHALGVSLPAKAVITRSYFKIITQFTDTTTGTVALSCEDANNIKTATDITGSSGNAFVEGASTGAISAAVRGIGAACEITATVADDAMTAGKLIGWVHYVVEN